MPSADYTALLINPSPCFSTLGLLRGLAWKESFGKTRHRALAEQHMEILSVFCNTPAFFLQPNSSSRGISISFAHPTSAFSPSAAQISSPEIRNPYRDTTIETELGRQRGFPWHKRVKSGFLLDLESCCFKFRKATGAQHGVAGPHLRLRH